VKRLLNKLFQTLQHIRKPEMRPRSLVNRILTLQAFWSVVVFIVAVVGIWWSSAYLIRDNLLQRGLQWAEELEVLGAPLYASSEPDASVGIGERIAAIQELSYVSYYDASGSRIIASYPAASGAAGKTPVLDSATVARLISTGSTNKPYFLDESTDSSVCRLVVPVLQKSVQSSQSLETASGHRAPEVLGFIDIGLDRTHYARMQENVLMVGGAVIAIIVLIALLVGRQLIKRALAPLSQLRIPLARLAQGETAVQVDSVGDEEIIAISNALKTTIKAVKERDEKLRKIADHDPLTGLVNRTYFMRELEETLEEASHGDASSALFFVDLDQFKYVNDTVGHGAGDRLLIQVAEALRHRARDYDVIARFGGDEFVVLARDVDRSSAVGVARALLKILQDMRFVEGGHSFNIYCSIGITMIDTTRYSVDELLSQADMACYQAKLRGRNRYHMHEISDFDKKALMEDVGWSQRIRDAIDNSNFLLHFQPIVGRNPGDREFYEVLLRMVDGDGATVAPSAFFQAAERFGMMVDVDYWVIENSLAALADHRLDDRDVRFSINLSGHVFEDQALASKIVEALEEHEIPGSAVVFEVTEQSAVRYMDRANSLIQSLQNHGCRFALDDFGTGFSSYGYIKSLPIDYIKISGDFIEDIRRDHVDKVMVKSMVEIAKALGKKIIAENIEDAETLKILQDMGVDYFQGYYFGAPLENLPDWDASRAMVNDKS
jgi:diguanylate cyclase (GGDEF)-like protein